MRFFKTRTMTVDGRGAHACATSNTATVSGWRTKTDRPSIARSRSILFAPTVTTTFLRSSYLFVNCLQTQRTRIARVALVVPCVAGMLSKWFRISGGVSPLCKRKRSGGFSCAPTGMRRRLCRHHHLTQPIAMSRKRERKSLAACESRSALAYAVSRSLLLPETHLIS